MEYDFLFMGFAKYRLPKISEFVLGFKFQVEIYNDMWVDFVFLKNSSLDDVYVSEMGTFTIGSKLDNGKIRVKI